jgi:hypothetical protein
VWGRGGFLVLFVALVLLVGCGSDSDSGTTVSTSTEKAATKPARHSDRKTVDPDELTAGQPAKRVMQCIALEGGFIEPLAPVRHKRKPPSGSFAHGVGPGESHIAVYLGTSPQEIDDWIEAYDRIGEYRATKTRDGRNLILLDVSAAPLDEEVAFHCIAAATD